MGIFKEIFGTLTDMKAISDLVKKLEGPMSELEKSGKCPKELKDAYEMLAGKAQSSAGNLEESMKGMENCIQVFEKYESLFPADIQKVIDKVEAKVEDLESIAKEIGKK
ncbi:MAG: hypothetical protein Q4D13_06615 [Erysipelotrichaceae bacterium]|nr:hypothetical protein [Erysipelotrichaceae bacterium]